jgi:hypothetical protein
MFVMTSLNSEVFAATGGISSKDETISIENPLLWVSSFHFGFVISIAS